MISEIPDETRLLEILLVDVNGVIRGKQIPAKQAGKLFNTDSQTSRVVMPRGTLFLDTLGVTSDKVAFGIKDGDPDRALLPVSDSISAVPWAKQVAQVLSLVAGDDPEVPWALNPRCVLDGVVRQCEEAGFQPVVAIELEFMLFRATAEGVEPAVQHGNMPAFSGPQTYNLDVLTDFSHFLSEVERACEIQSLPIAGITSEYGEGQFEINLKHLSEVGRACDQAVLLRRLIRNVAAKQGLLATFMAKPLQNQSGNGFHVHVSFLDRASGENIFNDSRLDPPQSMRHAIGGLLELMPASLALFAPNANSYRRFVTDSFAPVIADWGCDHRAVAVRIPHERGTNTRIEHRVAGADANPYLVVAAVLAGMLHGIRHDCDPGTATVGDKVSDTASQLPARWRESITAFSTNTEISQLLGEEFCAVYADLKYDEEERHHQLVPAIDQSYFLRMI